MTEFSRGDISLRAASFQDADLLLSWRNDQRTRTASKNSKMVSVDVHLKWLTEVISNPNRRLFVAEEQLIPFGTVRADYSEGVWLLSWTVSTEFRGRGLAKLMVALLADNLIGEIRAEIKKGNTASVRVAEYANMWLDFKAGDIMYFLRKNNV